VSFCFVILQCHSAQRYSIEYHNVKCHDAECHHTECHSAQSLDALSNVSRSRNKIDETLAQQDPPQNVEAEADETETDYPMSSHITDIDDLGPML